MPKANNNSETSTSMATPGNTETPFWIEFTDQVRSQIITTAVDIQHTSQRIYRSLTSGQQRRWQQRVQYMKHMTAELTDMSDVKVTHEQKMDLSEMLLSAAVCIMVMGIAKSVSMFALRHIVSLLTSQCGSLLCATIIVPFLFAFGLRSQSNKMLYDDKRLWLLMCSTVMGIFLGAGLSPDNPSQSGIICMCATLSCHITAQWSIQMHSTCGHRRLLITTAIAICLSVQLTGSALWGMLFGGDNTFTWLLFKFCALAVIQLQITIALQIFFTHPTVDHSYISLFLMAACACTDVWFSAMMPESSSTPTTTHKHSQHEL